MTRDEAAGLVAGALGDVAPEADVRGIDPDGLLQDEIGLDSIDFLTVVNVVGEQAGLHIPERDFPALVTFAGFVSYLVEGTGDDRRA